MMGITDRGERLQKMETITLINANEDHSQSAYQNSSIIYKKYTEEGMENMHTNLRV